MAKQHEVTYEEIVRDIRNRQFRPVYYLMGEEAYYIDRIADYIADTVLTPEQKDFNFSMLYGGEVTCADVVMAACRYPMMSDYQVILVKEAQNLKDLDALATYLKKPQPTTILVFCHKHGALDRRKKLCQDIEREGVLFESRKVSEKQLPQFIAGYVQRKGMTIDQKCISLLADYVGSDLNRMAGEIDKLGIRGDTRITSELIEKNIGISKEYNIFEFRKALVAKDIYKANLIVNYFDKNPKENPIQKILPALFSFFANLMVAHYAKTKNEQGIADALKLPSTWQAREYLSAMKVYSARKTMNIVAAIRTFDAKSKGFGNSMETSGELLKDLTYFILH